MSEEQQYTVIDATGGEVRRGAGVASVSDGPNNPSRIGHFSKVVPAAEGVCEQDRVLIYVNGAESTDLPEVWGLTVTEVPA